MGLYGICSMYISLLVESNLNRPFYPSFLRQTRTFNWIGKLRVITVLRPFLITSASLTQRSTYRRLTSLVASRITLALLVTIGNRGESQVILRQALKTNRVGIIPSGPTKSLIALTAIYRITSKSTQILLSSFQIILKARRSRVQQRSTLLMLLCASIDTSLILIDITFIYYLNSLKEKFFLALWIIQSSGPQ